MNKTIIININSIVFHIEEDAYEILQSYMAEIKKYFGQTADSEEILQDIENRIAEMFSERIYAGKKEVISSSDVDEIIARMGRV
ncbi:MAG TPA: PspC domain-containing protein, partial [Sphingobacterium sp.]|nr:PspC domain-containing protein [Sphingobacterium sp.]